MGICLLMFAACGSQPGIDAVSPTESASNEPEVGDLTPLIRFPQQAPVVGDREMMAADLIGEFVLDKGCLYVDEELSGIRYLPIWPPGYSYVIDSGLVQIFNESGVVVAREGSRVGVGGGTTIAVNGSLKEAGVNVELVQLLPQECTGELWLVGNGVRILADDETVP